MSAFVRTWVPSQVLRIGYLSGCALLTVVLTACTVNGRLDLARQLAKSLGAYEQSFAAIARDFYNSCTRKAVYLAVVRATESCALHKRASDEWRKANMIILAYLGALSDLAGGTPKDTDYGLKELVDAIRSAESPPLFTPEQAKDLVTLGTSLITYIRDLRRVEQVAKFAAAADKDVQKLIGILKNADAVYRDELKLERTAIDGFFLSVSRSSGVSGTETLQIRERWLEALRSLTDKEAAADAYVDALTTISRNHAAVVRAIEEMRSSNVANY